MAQSLLSFKIYEFEIYQIAVEGALCIKALGSNTFSILIIFNTCE